MPSIQLTREYNMASDELPGTYCMKITAESLDSDYESEIFVYRSMGTENPMPGDIFQCVASYAQMQELPIDSPEEVDGVLIPDYRVAVAEFFDTDPKRFDEIWTIIQSDAKLLMRQTAYSENLESEEVVTISSD